MYQNEHEHNEIIYANPWGMSADFACICKGDGMINARIFDGDVVFIQLQSTVEDGDIAAILVGDELILRRYHRLEDSVVLEAENPMCTSLRLNYGDMDNVQIIGRAVFFMSLVR